MRMRAALRISQGLSARRPANRPRDIETPLQQETDMRKIIVATFVSLDGVMQAPGGPEEDPTGGFKFGGWAAPHFDEALGAAMGEIFGHRSTCCSAARPTTSSPPTGPTQPTRTRRSPSRSTASTNTSPRARTEADWNNSHWLGEDTVAALKKLKAGDGPDLWSRAQASCSRRCGTGLVDEFNVLIFPVLLGKGKRLFGDGVPRRPKLVKSQSYPTGVIVTKYVPDGEVRTGRSRWPSHPRRSWSAGAR